MQRSDILHVLLLLLLLLLLFRDNESKEYYGIEGKINEVKKREKWMRYMGGMGMSCYLHSHDTL